MSMLPQDRENIHQIGTKFFPHVYNPLSFIIYMTKTLLGWLAYAITAFTRLEIGERYGSFIRFCLTLVVMQFVKDFAFFARALLGAFGGGSSFLGGWMFQYYTPLFVLMYVWQIWKNSRRKHYVHSLSFGTSRLMPLMWKLAKWLPKNLQNDQLADRLDWWTYRILEPSMVIGAGWIIGKTLDPTFGLYLQICAVALFLEAHIAYSEKKNRYYDALDAMIESQVLQRMIEGKPAPQQSGVHAIPMVMPSFEGDSIDIDTSLIEVMEADQHEPFKS